jgi:acetolactate synthase I/II/III large subunit
VTSNRWTAVPSRERAACAALRPPRRKLGAPPARARKFCGQVPGAAECLPARGTRAPWAWNVLLARDAVSDHVSVADFIADELVRLGVRHVFGVGGANIEDIFVAIQARRPALAAILCKHEHGAGTAADAYARIGRGVGVVLATSGGGALNLTHSLAEARASRVPVLAIVGEPPSALQGAGAFQDTSAKGSVDAARVLGAAAKWCRRAEHAREVPHLLAEALRSAAEYPAGPAVLLLAKDVQQAPVGRDRGPLTIEQPSSVPAPASATDAVKRAAELLLHGPSVIIAGDEVARAGAERELSALADVLGAEVAVTPDARDAFDNHDPRFLGVAGSMGHPDVARAISEARAIVLVGTRLPLLARQGLEGLLRERHLVSVGRDPPWVEAARSVHVGSDIAHGTNALVAALRVPLMSRAHRPVRHVSVALVPPRSRELDSRNALAAVNRATPDGSVLVVDAGNTGAAAVHELSLPRGGRWLIAMGMAGMGYAFGGAVGAAVASGRRCFVLAGDGAFFMHGLEIHTAVEHSLPITYVIFNNRAHGMCLVRERLLLHVDAGYNAFRRSHLGAAFGEMFPSLDASDCRTLGELEAALQRSLFHAGPSVIGVELAAVEVPPFAAFQAAGGEAFSHVERGAGFEDA